MPSHHPILRWRLIVGPRSHSGTARRIFFSVLHRRAMPTATDLSISPGEDRDAVVKQVTSLTDGEGKWQLCNNGKGLERAFKFKTFKATWEFMNRVADECKKQRHHPEWSNVYNKTHIRWTTHDPEGLSSKDTRMAQFCDEAGREFAELPMDPSECTLGPDGKVQAGDCCVRKA